jgi:hypothetical protein
LDVFVHMDSSRGLDDMDLPPARVDPSTPGRARIPRAGLVVLATIVALIAIALVLVLAVPRDPTTYAPGSPEAAFQTFYQAFEAGDLDGAHALFSAEIKKQMTLSEYRRFDAEQGWQRDQDRRVVLLSSDVTGDRANLHLRIDSFYQGGLGASRDSQERTIRLVHEDGVWLIDEPIIGVESVTYGF